MRAADRATSPAAPLRRLPMADRDLQCPVSLHRQYAPARSSRNRSCARTAPGASTPIRREAIPRAPSIRFALKTARRPGLSDRRLALEKLGRIRRARRAGDGFRVHGLRQRGRRNLPDLAGPTDDRALGHRRPGRRRGNGHRKGGAFVTAGALPEEPDFRCSSNLPLESLDALSLGAKLREIGRMEGASRPRPEVA